MDLAKVGEKLLSSVRSARSLGLLPSPSDRPEVRSLQDFDLRSMGPESEGIILKTVAIFLFFCCIYKAQIKCICLIRS